VLIVGGLSVLQLLSFRPEGEIFQPAGKKIPHPVRIIR
jgi:hypothetical protein